MLLRHAKAKRPGGGVPDAERALAGRGRRDAHAAGEVLAQVGPLPELVLCSPARRTRQTWAQASAALATLEIHAPPVRLEPALYGADPQDVLDLLRGLDADPGVVLVVGHEPTMSAATELLAGPGSNAHALADLRTKFPTSGLAVLRLSGDWAQLTAAGAVLERFSVPRG
jgi:phosphohistidine phosphatase